MTHWLRASIALAEDPHPVPPALTLGGSEPPVTAPGDLTQSTGLRGYYTHVQITHVHITFIHTYTHNPPTDTHNLK